MRKRTGGCLCGAVRYEISGQITDTVACYCKMCQRSTGNFLTANQLDYSDLSITGVSALTWYRSSDEASRAFCSHCGSPLFFRVTGSERVSVKTGTLDDTSNLPIAYSIYIEEVSDHCLINEQVPASHGYPQDVPLYPFGRGHS